MTVAQYETMRVFGVSSLSTRDVAVRVGVPPVVAGKILAGLFRRSWVTVTPSGRWLVTDRGRRKLGKATAA